MNRLVAVPAIERQEIRAFHATSRTRGERMFRRAARHSRLIRFLRIGIPVGIFAALSLIVGAAYFNPFKAPANVSLDQGKLVVSGTKIAMELPRLTGFTSDSLPYELTARVASQDLANPGVLGSQGSASDQGSRNRRDHRGHRSLQHQVRSAPPCRQHSGAVDDRI